MWELIEDWELDRDSECFEFFYSSWDFFRLFYFFFKFMFCLEITVHVRMMSARPACWLSSVWLSGYTDTHITWIGYTGPPHVVIVVLSLHWRRKNTYITWHMCYAALNQCDQIWLEITFLGCSRWAKVGHFGLKHAPGTLLQYKKRSFDGKTYRAFPATMCKPNKIH